MKIIKREGSLVVLQDKQGRYWLTRRKKHRHDNRRRKPTRVTYHPITQFKESELNLFTQKKNI